MGSWFQKPKNYSQNLLVATLNYGGIINGPFQFFSGQEESGYNGQSQNSNNEQKLISETFYQLMPLYKDLIGQIKRDDDGKITFKWDIGKIDQNFQAERYTPVYNKNAGIENGRFVTQKQFIQKWYQNVTIKWPQKEQKKIMKCDWENQKKVMMGFDLIAYHTFLAFLYPDKILKDSPLSSQSSALERLFVGKYELFMSKYFSRSYLDEDRKIKRLIYALSKNFHQDLLDQKEWIPGAKLIDVLFLQQPTETLLKAIKELKYKNQPAFYVSGNVKSVVIVVRRQRFIDQITKQRLIKNEIREEQIFIQMNNVKTLNLQKEFKQNFKYEKWPFALKSIQQQEMEFDEKIKKKKQKNQSTEGMKLKLVEQNPKLDPELFAIPQTNILVCQNFIFIGLHLSSKKIPNKIQCQILKKQLQFLNKFQNEYEIIASGDINSYLDNKGVQNYKIYPAAAKYLTTNKKRTYMQAQFNKANEQVTQCKDHIITNANMVKSGVMTIEIECATKEFLLPTAEHPFDHFMVVTLIKKRLNEKTEEEKKREENMQAHEKFQIEKQNKRYHAPIKILNEKQIKKDDD